MDAIPQTPEPDQARLAEIVYHRRQNRLIIYATLPSMFLYAGFYYHLSHYFQFCIFVLMLVNSIVGLVIGARLNDLHRLTIFKRVSAGIWFALLAVNLLTGLRDESIYYVVLPWIFIYPLAAVMFFSRGPGFFVTIIFTAVALVFFGANEIPSLTSRNIKMFQVNAAFALFSVLLISIIYEKMRMKIQDDLAVSEHQYKIAEGKQRKTNVELEQEIERRRQSEKALAESELHYRALFEESSVALWEEDWSRLKAYLDALPAEARDNLSAYFRQNPQILDESSPLMEVKAVNRATLQLFSADSQSALLGNLSRITAEDTADFIVQRVLSLYTRGSYHAAQVGTTLQGKTLNLLVTSTLPAGYENSWGKVYSSINDITDQMAVEKTKMRVEQQMQNARRIQAIATLAGGIAHQFNNALTVIFGNLELMEMNTRDPGRNQKYLLSLKSSAVHMSRLTDQLLAYAPGR